MTRGDSFRVVWHEACVVSRNAPIFAALASQGMIPKSGYRFSERIMPKH